MLCRKARASRDSYVRRTIKRALLCAVWDVHAVHAVYALYCFSVACRAVLFLRSAPSVPGTTYGMTNEEARRHDDHGERRIYETMRQTIRSRIRVMNNLRNIHKKSCC